MAGSSVGRTGHADRLQSGGSIVDAAARRQAVTAMGTPATATDAIQTATGLRAGSCTLAPADSGTRLAAYAPRPTPPTALTVQGGGEAALRDAIARHALSGFGPAPVAWSAPAAESITVPGNGLSTTPHGVAPQAPAAAMRLVADLAPAPPSAPVVLRLHPAELGVMEVEIARRAGGLAIELRVDTPEALRALEAERGALEGTLRREGEGGASVSISLRERRGDEAMEGQRATPHAVPDDDTTDTPAAVVRSTSRTI